MIELLAACTAFAVATPHVDTSPRFIESSAQLGLDVKSTGRVCVADLNGDDRPDVIASRTQVFLNRADPAATLGFRFESIDAKLVPPGDDGVAIYVDVDGDRIPDAIAFRSLDVKKIAERTEKNDTSPHAWWQHGRGDGTFDAPIPITATAPKTACAIAAGDVDRDGRTDLFVGNWYSRYGESNEAYTADLLLNKRGDQGSPRFERAALPEDAATFDEDHDLAGRPIYGALIAELLPRGSQAPPQLVELAYGRRWNRLYSRNAAAPTAKVATSGWRDAAAALGFDGDADRDGIYPSIAKRENEKPFRSNGNTFDMAIGDVNNDGRFDVFLAEITHFWAGSSADRSRFLIAEANSDEVGLRFVTPQKYCVDRFDPNDGSHWNQGDLFAELVDVDHDGRLDLFLASGDYPDPPPFDERLRLFHQRTTPSENGRVFEDVTLAAGIDHVGCGQIALADFDCDGRMDIVAGQSFNRFTPEMIAAAGGTPKVHLWLNRVSDAPPSIELLLRGDGAHGIAAQPFGAIVRITSGGHTLIRQLMGPGGHAGKQSEAIVHAPIGMDGAAHVEITWPCVPPKTTTHELGAGRHVIGPQ